MHNCRKIEEQLIDLVFGELGEDQSARLLAEIEDCGHCRAQYQSFKATLSRYDKAADLMLPDENYWNGYEARLQAKLVANEPVSLWQRVVDFAKVTMLRPTWAVSITALLLMALLLWFLLRQPTAIPSEQAGQNEIPTSSPAAKPEKDKPGSKNNESKNVATAGSTEGEKSGIQKEQNKSFKNNSTGKRKGEQVAKAHSDKPSGGRRQTNQPELSPIVSISEFDYLVRNLADDETVKHFEKAQNLLRSFRNLNAKASASVDEIADEKNRSRSLLLRNILLRREAEARANLPIEQVLSALEPLLIDIAHLPDKAPHSEIRAIRERIQRKEIIGKLQVYSARPIIAETTIE